jgi:hypothetical protein
MPDRVARSAIARSGIQRETREAPFDLVRRSDNAARSAPILALDSGSRDAASPHAVRNDDND